MNTKRKFTAAEVRDACAKMQESLRFQMEIERTIAAIKVARAAIERQSDLAVAKGYEL